MSRRRTVRLGCELFALSTVFATSLSAQDVGKSRVDSLRRTMLAVDVSYANFQGSIDPWSAVAISLSHRSAWGSLIGRANVANRFATSGTQIEVDAYPRTGKSTYLYLNAGYSQSSIFPEWRFGGDPVTLYTGAVGRYFGNYWASVRPFVRFKSSGTSASAGVTVRRYFEDADNYVGMRASYGSSPTDNTAPEAIGRSNSNSFGVHGSHTLSARYLWNWSAGRDVEQLSATNTRTSLTASLGLKYLF